MKRAVFIFTIIMALSACLSQQSEPLPVSEDKLVQIMFDVHVAEAALAQHLTGEKKDSIANEYYEQVAEIQGIDRPVLDTCIAIMQRNPELAKEIYEQLMEMMEKKRLEK